MVEPYPLESSDKIVILLYNSMFVVVLFERKRVIYMLKSLSIMQEECGKTVLENHMFISGEGEEMKMVLSAI